MEMYILNKELRRLFSYSFFLHHSNRGGKKKIGEKKEKEYYRCGTLETQCHNFELKDFQAFFQCLNE